MSLWKIFHKQRRHYHPASQMCRIAIESQNIAPARHCSHITTLASGCVE